MKTVFNGQQVGHVWAAQSQASGRNAQGNFSFDGAGIYSYRQGYCIATFTPWKDERGNRIIIAREAAYGPTTGRHMRQAQGSTRGHAVAWIECDPSILSPLFRDYASSESRKLAAGDVPTGRCVIRALVAHAGDSAAHAVTRLADSAIGYQYRKAADYLASAQTLAGAILATLKGAEKKKEARVIAGIIANSPELPAGYLARAIADSKRGQYPGWQAPADFRAAWDCARSESAIVAAMPVGDCVAFWRAARLAQREEKKTRELANAIADAKKFDSDARKFKTVHAATRARQAWLALVILAKRQKIAAATRALWIAAEKRAIEREEARKPAQTIERGLSMIQWYETANANLIRAAAIARKSGDCRRVKWQGNASESKRATKAAYNRGFESLRAIGDSVSLVSRTIKGGQHPHADTSAKMADLRALAGKRGKLQAQARDIVSKLESLAAIGLITGNHASARAAGRRASLACYQFAKNWHAIPALTVQTASIVERESAQLSRAWPQASAAIMRAHGLPDKSAVDSLHMRAKSYGQAANAGAQLREIECDVNLANESLAASAERMKAGLVFDALKSAERARDTMNSAERQTASLAASIARALESDEWGQDIQAAFKEASAQCEILAASVSALAPIVAANLAQAAQAAQAASANALGHWRATGEAARGLWDSLPSGAYFRMNSRGEIVSSQGAIVSADAGARLWALIRAAVSSARGKTWDYGKGPRVGAFHLESVNADGSSKVGCHWITAQEARAFAEMMKWPPFNN